MGEEGGAGPAASEAGGSSLLSQLGGEDGRVGGRGRGRGRRRRDEVGWRGRR